MKTFDVRAVQKFATSYAQIVVVSGTSVEGALLAVTPEMTNLEIDAKVDDLKKQLDDAASKAKAICQ